MRFLGYETEKSVECGESSPSSWRLQEFAALQVSVGRKGNKNQRELSQQCPCTHSFSFAAVSVILAEDFSGNGFCWGYCYSMRDWRIYLDQMQLRVLTPALCYLMRDRESSSQQESISLCGVELPRLEGSALCWGCVTVPHLCRCLGPVHPPAAARAREPLDPHDLCQHPEPLG